MIITISKLNTEVDKLVCINYDRTKIIINLTTNSILIGNRNRILGNRLHLITSYNHMIQKYFNSLIFSDNYVVSYRTKINSYKYEYYKIFFSCKVNMIKILYFFNNYFIRKYYTHKFYHTPVIHEIKIFNSDYNYFINNYIIMI